MTHIETQKQFEKIFEEYFNELYQKYNKITIVCIGSDLVIFDSLGPIVGHLLTKHYKLDRLSDVKIIGTLDNLVHAVNLTEKIQEIKEDNTLIIAIDAGMVSKEYVGKIGIKKGPINPGAGFDKQLPAIGHISIYGGTICPEDRFYPFKTRIEDVFKMAEIIAKGLNKVIREGTAEKKQHSVKLS